MLMRLWSSNVGDCVCHPPCRAEVHYTTTVLQTVLGIPTLTRVARSWLSDWFSASDLLFASPRGRLELTTTPSLVLTYGRAYFVEVGEHDPLLLGAGRGSQPLTAWDTCPLLPHRFTLRTQPG